ncbi:MAG TPA: L,D-transpeptidase family protein [Armatimonadota bacterium]|nr:L,D-transpeptidase family protein [Armatimonadota bacterium]
MFDLRTSGRWGRGVLAVAVAAMVLAPGAARAGQPGAAGDGSSDTRAELDGVTFASTPGTLYVPVREIGERLGWHVGWDAEDETVTLNGEGVPGAHLRSLPDGTRLIKVRALRDWDAAVSWDGDAEAARVRRGGEEVTVRKGEKRVAINLEAQRMRAWQGNRKVLDTRISSGRPRMETPRGSFRAGPLKTRMLISRKYGDAEMPWSVQVRGDIVIHGFPSVPARAASHGCIRVPLTGSNPARWFYRWVPTGAPIRIANGWPEKSATASR